MFNVSHIILRYFLHKKYKKKQHVGVNNHRTIDVYQNVVQLTQLGNETQSGASRPFDEIE